MDGSIYVCFLCEKEFREVSLLQEHMTEHGTLPEMSEEFPSRKKSKSKQNEEKKSVMLKSKQSIHKEPAVNQKTHNSHSIEDLTLIDNSKIKSEPKTYFVLKSKSENEQSSSKAAEKMGKDISKVNTNQDTIRNDSKNIEKKAEKISTLHTVTIKPDPDEFSLAMQRAMKIKKYIERKENTAKRKIETENQEEEQTEQQFNGMDDSEYEGPQESIMMVDSSFFSSGGSKTPIGPTIMNAEPEGFMVPQKVNSGKISQQQRRKRKIKLMNENFYVQEVYAEESDGYELESEISKHVQMYSPNNTINRRGRGRGRGKRGRPTKIKEEQIDESSIGYYKEIRPGRRSKPRESLAEKITDQSYRCLECYKEFRTLSTMKVHMKSHAEDREIPCPYCDEVFPQRYILYEHLVNDHEESSSLTCPICNKIFTRPDSLKSHMVRMHEENGGLNCFVCGKNFPSQGQLEMHVRVHTGERPFKCDLCGKGFVQKVHLRTHLRTMHNMTETNNTPCRLCNQKCNGRAGLRDHYTTEHGITTAQYKNQVAKLRKEGKIPEIIPPKVKVVDPSFRYQKVSVSEVKDVKPQEPQPPIMKSRSATDSEHSDTKESVPIYLTRVAGRKFKIKTKLEKERSTPGMGTVMNLVSDDMMFSPVNFNNMESDQPKGRDQEELNIVESAFKVAEEMDQLKDGTSATILMGDDSSSSSIYYSLPIEEDADEEYAQFAAEHAHIGLDQEESELDASELQNQGTRSSSRRGAIVKAEPLEIYSDNMGSSQAIEMLTM